MINELMNIGLSEKESEVYIYLIKSKQSTASKISKEKNINRSVVYNILESLIKKGLVNYITLEKIKRFSAATPNTLADFIKSKENSLKKILPQLKLLKPEINDLVNVEVFQGINGALNVMNDILNNNKEYAAFGEGESFKEIMKTLSEQYVRKLNERKIKERLLVPQGQKILKGKNTQVKYLPKNILLPSLTAIYGNKVAIAIFQKPYYIIVIESKELSITYLSLFEFLWKIAKE